MNYYILVISIFSVLIDQVSKGLINSYLGHPGFLRLTKYLSLETTYNDGAAWNILSGNQIFLITISLIILVIVYSMMYQLKKTKVTNFAFGILIGGIFGNLIDRIFQGSVTDFIRIDLPFYKFPIFNIADICIVIGVFILIIESIRKDIKNDSRSRKH